MMTINGGDNIGDNNKNTFYDVLDFGHNWLMIEFLLNCGYIGILMRPVPI